METETSKKTPKLKIAKEPKHKAKLRQQVASKEPAKDLQEKINALKLLAQTSNLLQNGSFPWTFREQLTASIQFIDNLYQPLLTEALAHKDANKVPALVEIRVKKEVSDAKN